MGGNWYYCEADKELRPLKYTCYGILIFNTKFMKNK